jgi:hypothetical protein
MAHQMTLRIGDAATEHKKSTKYETNIHAANSGRIT